MAFSRPSLQQLIDRLGTDLKTRLGLTGAVLRRSVLGILARVYAAAVHSLYGYLDYIARQSHPLTAEGQWLDRWGALWRVVRKPAAFARGEVRFEGKGGSEIPKGSIVQRGDGEQYQSTQRVTLLNASVNVPVSGVQGGAQGNLLSGAVLSLISPIGGVQTRARSVGDFTSGGDNETDTDLRARVIARIQTPAQGGTKEDYRQWALSVAGVTRVFVFENFLGGGTVGVTFVTDNAANLIPDVSKVAEVRAVIEVNRPLMVDVSVFAPIRVVVDFDIRLRPNTPGVQAAAQNELLDLFRRESQPGLTILLSHINEAISIGAGELDHTLVRPRENITLAENEIAVLGTITW